MNTLLDFIITVFIAYPIIFFSWCMTSIAIGFLCLKNKFWKIETLFSLIILFYITMISRNFYQYYFNQLTIRQFIHEVLINITGAWLYICLWNTSNIRKEYLKMLRQLNKDIDKARESAKIISDHVTRILEGNV